MADTDEYLEDIVEKKEAKILAEKVDAYEKEKRREEEEREELKAPASSEAVTAAEEESGSTINPTRTVLTNSDIKDLTINPDINTPRTTVKIDYVIEKIPVPSSNNITILSNSTKIWNRTKQYYNEGSDSEPGQDVFAAQEENIVSGGGQSAKVRVLGDNNATFELVVKDITNIKWYDWENEEFINGYKSVKGVANSNELFLNIPPQASETTYNIFFEKAGSSIYDASLPTEDYPWIINQLINPTITFKFYDDAGFTSNTTTTTTHLPNAILNSGSTNDGKIDINITTVPVRGVMALNSERTISSKISIYDIDGGDVEILATDLTVSVSSNIGTISGTITLGKGGLRSSDILFYPSNFFIIT